MAPEQRWDADEAVSQLFAAHYAGLVRLAALLVRNSGEAEEIVQDAYVGLHRRWRRLREPERAVGYLRQSVVNGARSAQRRNVVADRRAPTVATTQAEPSAESHALAAETRLAVMNALHTLPERQREVLVLRYYSDLSEAAIADALGISRGAVKTHASRGIRALRTQLEDQS
jgi:RNA polymerase sigma-70 factor (sigma-E family)